MGTERIREQKRHYNKADQEFDCELLYQDRERVVLRYVAERSYQVSGRPVAAGSTTLGLYLRGERYVFWKMLDPNGKLEAYLVHLCEPIEIGHGVVTYRDRMLDLWQEPPSPPVLLDEEDLEEAVREGWVTPEIAQETLEAAQALLARFAEVVLEAEMVLAWLVSAPEGETV